LDKIGTYRVSSFHNPYETLSNLFINPWGIFCLSDKSDVLMVHPRYEFTRSKGGALWF